MMDRTQKLLLVISFASLAIVRPASTSAQLPAPFDHLKCSRVLKDLRSVEEAEGLTLTPDQIEKFAAQTGCRLRSARAHQLCVPATKSPSDPPGGDDLKADYVCYHVKCDPPESKEPIIFDVRDQFGVGTLHVRQRPGDSSQTLCVPSRYRCRNLPPATLPFNDQFNQSDGTDLSAGWVKASGELAISGNALVSGFGGDSIAVLNGISNANTDVRADISLANATTDASAGLLLRTAGPPGICDTGCPTSYVGRIRKTGSTYRAEIVKSMDCASSTLASEVVASSSGSLRFTSFGSSLTLSLDSMEVATASDTSIGAGTVGVIASGSGVSFDNFQSQDFMPPPTPTP
jgi:hypothetical protein